MKVEIEKDEYGYFASRVGEWGISRYISNGYTRWDRMSYWKTLNGITRFLKKQYPKCKIILKDN